MKILTAVFLVLISAVGVSAQTVSCYYTDSKFAFSLRIDTASNTQNYQLENGGTYHPFKGNGKKAAHSMRSKATATSSSNYSLLQTKSGLTSR